MWDNVVLSRRGSRHGAPRRDAKQHGNPIRPARRGGDAQMQMQLQAGAASAGSLGGVERSGAEQREPPSRSAAAREGHQPRGGPSRSRSARLQSSGPVCRHARLELSPPAARDARRPAVPAPGTSPCLSPAVVLSRDSAGFPCAAVAVAVAPTTTGN